MAPPQVDETADLLNLPIEIAAAPRRRFGQCLFFQAAGMPAPFVQTLQGADVKRQIVRALGQWRLDVPPLPDTDGTTPDERVLLSVAEAILTRGAVPFCSPFLEAELGAAFDQADDPDGAQDAARRVLLTPSTRFVPTRAESAEERELARWLRTVTADENLAWTVVPQVELAGLTPVLDPARSLRGDFLLVHPERDPILVEVDGKEHQGHEERDEERDRALESAGVRIVRIAAEEVRAGSGSGLAALAALLRQSGVLIPDENELARAVRWCRLFHQVQLAMLVAMKGGWMPIHAPWHVGVVLPSVLTDDVRADRIVSLAANDLREMLGRLASLYGHDVPHLRPEDTHSFVVTGPTDAQQVDLVIGPGDGRLDDMGLSAHIPLFEISDVALPRELRAPITACAPRRMVAPNREDARWFLRYLFRKDDFWEGQWEAIERSLRGEDSLVLLPTGAGKSIAFQLAALLLPGLCLVVDPILSLIEDQIDNLGRVGIDRAIGITSLQGTQQRDAAQRSFQTGHFLFCYIAPERFQTTVFREALRALTVHTPISLVAVDEAHCVSEWGHDFRTAYLGLGRVARAYGASQGVVPPLTALTGTASKIVLKDVQRELGITPFDAIITPATFDRGELHFKVVDCNSDEKSSRVVGLLQSLPTVFNAPGAAGFFRTNGPRTNAGLVFCPHTAGPFGVLKIAERLSQTLGIPVEVYSGKSPYPSMSRKEWDQRKRRIARDFKRNRVTLLACTSAFGMGIDKPNIRYTVHIGLPESIESFYQEAGRAGRDRRVARSALVLSHELGGRSSRLLAPDVPLSAVASAVNDSRLNERDDVLRALWFHITSFRGEDQEVADLRSMLDALDDIQKPGKRAVSWETGVWGSPGDTARERAEKALHRLVVMGVVTDYTVNFSGREFSVDVADASREAVATALGRYASGYQRRLGERLEGEIRSLAQEDYRDFVLGAGRRLAAFIYENVELARRRAMDEMLQAARVGLDDGELLRRRVLDYLEHSEWDERLEEVRASAGAGTELDILLPILDELVSPNDAASLRGAVGRMLTSYPDVPGLLLLRALAEVLSADGDGTVARDNVVAALNFARRKFDVGLPDLATAMAEIVRRASNRKGAADTLLHAALDDAVADRSLVREMAPRLPHDLAPRAISWLAGVLAARCAALIPQEEEKAA